MRACTFFGPVPIPNPMILNFRRFSCREERTLSEREPRIKMNLNIDLKKFLILLLALIVIFTPTYIAIANYAANREAPPSPDSLTVLTVKDPEGRITTATNREDPNNYIELFRNINASSSQVNALPEHLAGTNFVLVTVNTDGNESAYKYYISTNASDCYYTDGAGNSYHLSSAAAKAFLATGMSIFLYKSGTPPTMTVAGGNLVAPRSLNWSYLVSGNTYQTYTEENADALKLDDVGNVLSPVFSIAPSSCTLKVYAGDNATPVWDGKYDQLSALNPSRNTTYRFEVAAQWAKSTECEYYGEATYVYYVSIDAPAIFKLNRTNIFQGEFAVISAVNVTDPTKINVTCDHDLGYTPVFFPDSNGGDAVHALIPISYGLEKGTYVFSVSYGVTSTNLTLLVGDYRYGYKTATSEISKDKVSAVYSDTDVEEYEKLVSTICGSNESMKYFDGAFLDYQKANVLTKKGAAIKLGFGRLVTLKNSDPVKKYEHTGVDFEVAANTDVPALNSGKVVYAGSCDVLGNFVVVDHGFGLKTWYSHLSVLSVSVGNIITKGQAVGKTGDTGLTLANRVHIGVTVYDVPVAPYGLWEEGVTFASFE